MKLNLHPVHYLFLAATFFSFYLMYSYFSDHINIYITFGIASIVSIALTVTYLRLFAPPKIIYLLAPVTQLIFLIIFSFSFFFEGLTGVLVTICSVVTLFILMQITGKINWSEMSKKELL
jgi:inner membrane protein involved in colicin E2 resistance